MNHWLEHHLNKTNNNTIGYAETDEEAVIFVQRKMPMAELQLKVSDKKQKEWRAKDIVPDKIRTGLFTKKKTDVVELGHIKAEVDRKKYDPFKAGCEIQPHGAHHVGTAGAIIKYYAYKEKPLIGWLKSFVRILEKLGRPITIHRGIITNSHVANKDPSKPQNDVWINQPYQGRMIGRTIYSLPLGPYYDASILSLEETFEETIIEVGQPKNYRPPRLGEEVKKYGRTTRYTEGNVLFKGVSIAVDYGSAGVKKIKNCVVLTNMSDSGDSGSVIVSKKDDKAVGLLFAGSSKATIAQPIDSVLEKTGAWL